MNTPIVKNVCFLIIFIYKNNSFIILQKHIKFSSSGKASQDLLSFLKDGFLSKALYFALMFFSYILKRCFADIFSIKYNENNTQTGCGTIPQTTLLLRI
jgi:hypothetical protein